MRFRLRTLLIVLALALVLLRVVLPMLENVHLPGDMLTWCVLVVVYHYVIPFGLILIAIAAVVLRFWAPA